MSIIINWIDPKNKVGSGIEMPLFGESFSIYFVDNIITKTEWNLRLLNNPGEINKQWKDIQRYLNNPTETLTIHLKKQGSVFRNKVWAEMCKIPVG